MGCASRCYCALTGLTGLAVKATMMLSPLITMNFLVVCSTNLNQKNDDAAKRKEGLLSAVPAKKIDDNSFAEAALQKLFVQYSTLPSSAAVDRLLSSAGHRKYKLYSATANLQVCRTFVVIFCTSATANDFLLPLT